MPRTWEMCENVRMYHEKKKKGTKTHKCEGIGGEKRLIGLDTMQQKLGNRVCTSNLLFQKLKFLNVTGFYMCN